MSHGIDRLGSLWEGVSRRRFLRAGGSALLASQLLACAGKAPGESRGGHVIVVGAGLSGLLSALLLEERGIKVTVLEARDRAGGRVVTMNNVAGRPEGGGPVIGGSYKRVHRIAELLSVPIGSGQGFDRSLSLYVGGQLVRFEDWANSSANQTVGPERQMPPSRLKSFYVGQDVPLADFDDWTSPQFGSLDISLEQLLRQRGASDEAIRLVNISPNTNEISTTSALWALRDAQRRRDTAGMGIVGIEGGNQALTDAMARGIQGEVKLGTPVTAIRSGDDGAEVLVEGGQSFQADYVVVTVPFSVLRQIELDPAPTGPQAEAIASLPYTATTKFFFEAQTPFWETAGHSASLWTDTIIERIFPVRDAQGKVQNLTCWVDGTNAQKLDGMTPREREDTVLAQLEQIFPGSSKQVRIADSISWGLDPYAGGAYAHYAPGQIVAFKQQMAAPLGRLHFAGEHTAVHSPGMESALESAERATDEVFGRLG